MRVLILLLLVVFLSKCGGGSSSPTLFVPLAPTINTALSLPPEDERDWLTQSNLIATNYPHSSPIHNAYFMPVGVENSAIDEFSGTIQVNAGRLIGNFSENYISGDESFKNFPQVDLSFVSFDGALIPLNRDRQVSLSDDSFWGIILDPGKVWSESSDNGWSRASFPFTFISARRNQGHNGLATFLYKNNEISHLRIQIVQETALWFKNDMYAQLAVNYIPTVFNNAQSIITAFQNEVTNSEPILPWSDLENIGTPASLNEFNNTLPSNTINQTAVIKDGVVYLQPCYTRYGDYPYCRWMRNGAYSVTKSLGASVAMFRLAEKYSEQVFDLLITDYVNVTSTHSGWDNVTFGDVLNMAAGIGDEGGQQDSGQIFADENQAKMESWIQKNSEQAKLIVSFSYGNYSWGPDVEFKYNSALYFVLASALNNYYQSEVGVNADIWDMVVNEVYQPIGIQHVPKLRTIEAGGGAGIAELFHGLYPNVDDMAKLSKLLQNGGVHNGTRLLHQRKLAEGLFQTEQTGLHSWWEDNQFAQSRYLHGFWTSPFGSSGNCVKQIPYMSGYGGNIFAILPNGISLFRFSDSESYSPFEMIRVSDRERDICN